MTWRQVWAEAIVGTVLMVGVYAYLLAGGFVGWPWEVWT